MVNNKSVQVLPISAYDDNYVWLLRDERTCLVVDPGDAQPVIAYLKEHRLVLKMILITHHHADHVGGIAELIDWCEKQQTELPIIYGPSGEDIPWIDEGLMQGDSLHIQSPACDLMVLDVPGHTAGHIAYFIDTGTTQHVFSGDTLFACGCGRIFEGTPQQMFSSLEKFSQLPPTTLVHAAHEYTLSNIRFALEVEPGNQDLQDWAVRAKALRQAGKPTLPTTIDHELKVNPFLRSHIQAVMARAISHQPGLAKTPLAVFAALRVWKDVFK